ncbi:MAG: 2Fe-2S iron-sulfur cluster binding domain-containing protein [Candidatus Izimaplasma sp.]|nr:2Fe-2S iron-sulfur cluster binding domain-containing protein [Candidatus Izimaplasma bacterium]
MKINVKVNGYNKVYDVAPDEYLLDTLRADNFFSIKRGCENSSCGVCTVLFDGKAIQSCSILSVKADGHEVTTIEGHQEEAKNLSEHFGHQGADQCGYCNSSLALTVHAMKSEIKKPTEKDIKDYLVGNLCRCTGYEGQHKAIIACLEDEE